MRFPYDFQQVARMSQHLMDAGRASEDPGLVAAGLGIGMKGGEIDDSRPLVARYYVKEKPATVTAATETIRWKVPRTVKVPLTDSVFGGPKWKIPTLTLPTDITAIGQVVPVGRRAKASDGSGRAVTSGGIVRWRDTLGQTEWAIVTVAHGFVHSQGIPVSIFGNGPQPLFVGFLMATAFPNQSTGTFGVSSAGLDAALVTVNVGDLLASGLLLSETLPRLPIQEFTFLSAANDQDDFPGFSQQVQRNVGYTIVGALAQLPVGGLGTIVDVLQLKGGQKLFKEGTSGSIIQLVDASPTVKVYPVGIQIASNNPDFNDGYAQSLHRTMKWCQETVVAGLNSLGRTLSGSVEFVGTF